MSGHDVVAMANQIAGAFRMLDEAAAIDATEDHLRKFWDPRMRARLVAALDAGAASLDPVARQATLRLSAGS